MARLGMPVTDLGPEPGEAAGRKLARSVFMKGLAAAVEESLAAGEALGFADWLREDIDQTLESADAGIVGRLLEGSRRHAVRRMRGDGGGVGDARGAGRRAAHRPRGRGLAAHAEREHDRDVIPTKGAA